MSIEKGFHGSMIFKHQDLVACAQLGRLAVGGYFVLRCDFVTWRDVNVAAYAWN